MTPTRLERASTPSPFGRGAARGHRISRCLRLMPSDTRRSEYFEVFEIGGPKTPSKVAKAAGRSHISRFREFSKRRSSPSDLSSNDWNVCNDWKRGGSNGGGRLRRFETKQSRGKFGPLIVRSSNIGTASFPSYLPFND